MTLDWVPERFPPSGSLAAEGFSKLLGRPKLDPLTVLVRETAQNSWDARDGSGRPVKFRIDGRTLTDAVRQVLRGEVFGGSSTLTGMSLRDILDAEAITGLYISDRNTKGLGGPVQANQVSPDRLYHWANFVLNVGKANTQVHAGGTYGFGKTIGYVVSSAHTVVIHTRTLHHGRPVTRLIASAIGEQFVLDGTLCTGRHWWGRELHGGPIPVEGSEADTLASAIGMPEFTDDEFGTNILILAPDFGGRTPRQGMTFIAESVLWHLWPKMISFEDSSAMTFTISWDEDAIPIPTPEDRPPLHAFVRAFRELRPNQPSEQQPAGLRRHLVARERPRTIVGDLVTVPFVAQQRARVDDGHDLEDPDSPGSASPFTDRACHHVVLLRTPELVVEYHEGPPSPEGGMEWAGVFRVRDEHDSVFAQAEPATHDSWQPEQLKDRTERSIVSKSLRDIRNIVAGSWGTAKTAPPTASSSTAIVADALAHLLGPVGGQGKGQPEPPVPTSGAARTRVAKVELLSSGPQLSDGSPATFVRLRVTPRPSATSTRISVEIGVALDGSTSDPSLDEQLRLVSSTIDNHSLPLEGRRAFVTIPGNSPREVLLLATRSSYSSILWNVHVEQQTELGVTA